MAIPYIRLGKIMEYTSSDGVTHPTSFWMLEDLHASVGSNRLSLKFIGYHNMQSYTVDRKPIADAVKEYNIVGYTDFHAIIDQLPLASNVSIGGLILLMAWQVAIATKDIGPNPGPDEEDLRVSFFETAVDPEPPVIVPPADPTGGTVPIA